MTESPMREHPFVVAARYNDSECEEHSFENVITKQGVDINSLLYISEQRALLILWNILGRDMSIFKDGNDLLLLSLSPQERVQLVHYQSAVLDGIMIGWRAQNLTGNSHARD